MALIALNKNSIKHQGGIVAPVFKISGGQLQGARLKFFLWQGTDHWIKHSAENRLSIHHSPLTTHH